MKKPIILAAMLAISNNIYADSDLQWSYSGLDGPEYWATLSADNFACSGKNQSPINLTGMIKAELTPIKFDYQKGGNVIINDGHTIKIDYLKGSTIEIDNLTFELIQVHFHAPSENHIEGKSYPLEAHFVHANENGELTVIAVMYQHGIPNQGLIVDTDNFKDKTVRFTASPNKTLKQIWSLMPTSVGEKQKLSDMINLTDILPKNKDYYRFNGSLTTPPCSEGVRWLVMKDVVTVSKKQINDFSNILTEPNNRPIQSLNSRKILQ